MSDPLTALADLRSAAPRPERAGRIRTRCRAELARHAGATDSHTTQERRRGGSRLWHTAAASLCVAYVVEVIALAAEVLQSR